MHVATLLRRTFASSLGFSSTTISPNISQRVGAKLLSLSLPSHSFSSAVRPQSVRRKLTVFYKATHPDRLHNAPPLAKLANEKALQEINAYFDGLLSNSIPVRQTTPVTLFRHRTDLDPYAEAKLVPMTVRLPGYTSKTSWHDPQVIADRAVETLLSALVPGGRTVISREEVEEESSASLEQLKDLKALRDKTDRDIQLEHIRRTITKHVDLAPLQTDVNKKLLREEGEFAAPIDSATRETTTRRRLDDIDTHLHNIGIQTDMLHFAPALHPVQRMEALSRMVGMFGAKKVPEDVILGHSPAAKQRERSQRLEAKQKSKEEEMQLKQRTKRDNTEKFMSQHEKERRKRLNEKLKDIPLAEAISDPEYQYLLQPLLDEERTQAQREQQKQREANSQGVEAQENTSSSSFSSSASEKEKEVESQDVEGGAPRRGGRKRKNASIDKWMSRLEEQFEEFTGQTVDQAEWISKMMDVLHVDQRSASIHARLLLKIWAELMHSRMPVPVIVSDRYSVTECPGFVMIPYNFDVDELSTFLNVNLQVARSKRAQIMNAEADIDQLRQELQKSAGIREVAFPRATLSDLSADRETLQRFTKMVNSLLSQNETKNFITLLLRDATVEIGSESIQLHPESRTISLPYDFKESALIAFFKPSKLAVSELA